MIQLPETTSRVEAWWILGSVIGLVGTIAFMAVLGRVALRIAKLVRVGSLSWSGPRWTYVSGMLVSMALFLVGWVVFFILGVLAGAVPPSPYAEETPDIFGAVILVGMLSFATGQLALVLMWFRVQKAPPTPWSSLGIPGPAGPAGVAGPAGPAGPIGVHGEQGEQGEQGRQGVSGDGRRGPSGAQGPVGPQGQIGPEGPESQGIS